jgi:hypothetical protein
MIDSIGNELPNEILLVQNTGNNSLTEGIALNIFLSACKNAIPNGQKVVYDKERRLAEITDLNGRKFTATH